MHCTYWDMFSTAQNSFWTHWFWCLLVFLLCFVSHFPLRTFFNQRNKQTKNCSGWDLVNRMGEVWGSHWTLTVVWTGVLINHPLWNGQNTERVFNKNSLKPNAASHTTTSWYTDIDMFLKHLSSRGNPYYKGPTLRW